MAEGGESSVMAKASLPCPPLDDGEGSDGFVSATSEHSPEPSPILVYVPVIPFASPILAYRVIWLPLVPFSIPVPAFPFMTCRRSRRIVPYGPECYGFRALRVFDVAILEGIYRRELSAVGTRI